MSYPPCGLSAVERAYGRLWSMTDRTWQIEHRGEFRLALRRATSLPRGNKRDYVSYKTLVRWRIKCRERTQRVATSGSRTSVRAGTPRSCATKPRPHATSKAKNGRGCFLRFQHLAGFIFAEKSVQWKAERQMSKASFVARN